MKSLGHDVVSLVRPSGVNCWIYFGFLLFTTVYTVQLLSLFISFLYLVLYLLVDDASIS